MLGMFKKLFGDGNSRYLKKITPLVARINQLEKQFASKTDGELKGLKQTFSNRKQQGENILPEAFATVREAAKRTLGQRHFDVQLMGGIALNDGSIAEMKTGEGKTLVSTLPAYLNALEGNGVHIVTVNDYLARRDSLWMGEIFEFLGLKVGCVTNATTDRKAQYEADITYVTNNEIGFDYLRDNMALEANARVIRGFGYAIVDEVDSILIDEARTPLIISGRNESSSELYIEVDKIIPKLSQIDYEKDEKSRTVTLTEQGSTNAEQMLQKAGILKGSLYAAGNVAIYHHLNQALKAHILFKRDVDYIVQENKVVIIDEFTGRMMQGRRYSDGLHQALEAKERVKIEFENQTLASITFQNFFRLYNKLSGMTGTATTEATEFQATYGLGVVSIPTHQPLVRADENDEIWRTESKKLEAVANLIKQRHQADQPILVGTVSIEKSEQMSAILTKNKIRHNVLNARNHEKEAAIIAGAGAPGAVTIATNMAGRGTDIQLGGNPQVRIAKELGEDPDPKAVGKIQQECEKLKAQAIAAGGLFVIGTERHESRRIDNQLRGRSGRQGDPGSSRFFLSLEDELMRIFGGEKLDKMMQRLGLDDSEAIVHTWINKAILKAQQRVENHNFEIRRNLLRFDDVMNEQRKVIYGQRNLILDSTDPATIADDLRDQAITNAILPLADARKLPEEWDKAALHARILALTAEDVPLDKWLDGKGTEGTETKGKGAEGKGTKSNGVGNKGLGSKMSPAHLIERVKTEAANSIQAKRDQMGQEIAATLEKNILLRVLDGLWRDHLLNLDHLRQGINLRAYGQRDPLNEYKKEAFEMFGSLLEQMGEQVTVLLAHLEVTQTDRQTIQEETKPQQARVTTSTAPLSKKKPKFSRV